MCSNMADFEVSAEEVVGSDPPFVSASCLATPVNNNSVMASDFATSSSSHLLQCESYTEDVPLRLAFSTRSTRCVDAPNECSFDRTAARREGLGTLGLRVEHLTEAEPDPLSAPPV